ncbi:MAG: endopeptidase La [Clostridiales Family XIII bacterium]|jgi:ATP-dependent Lon protease|nr:endopeptidase La [Clostridiales Family XIII bacterium]
MGDEVRNDNNYPAEVPAEDFAGGRRLTLPVIPLRGLTAFPEMVFHFDVGREKSINALEKAMMSTQTIFLVTQKNIDTELPTADDYYDVGIIAKIKQMLKLPGDSIRVLVEGTARGRIVFPETEVSHVEAIVEEVLPEDYGGEVPAKIEALVRIVLDSFDEYLSINQKASGDVYASIESLDHPGQVADAIASHMDFKTEAKQSILGEFDVEKRLTLLEQLLDKEIEIERIEQDIGKKVRSKINQNQREYYLREQLKTIQEELGSDESVENEVGTWLRKLKKLKLEKKIHDKIEKEIKRLSKMQPGSAEATVIRSYVDWVFELPWNVYSGKGIDLPAAEKKLDADHYGLEKVKERILEYLAVMELAPNLKAPILCLVGPPGVGKTSIAKSVAAAMGRSFVRMSLGGVRDEAEIRGHRRTYIGSIPGRIINGMKEAKAMDPVFLFDEIDKIGADFRGDPASALLEVLDPEQNKEFTDHYLEFAFDLSKVFFITTANTADTIPRPLLDRMELIEVPGYTEQEKVKIAERYLVPKQLSEHGLTGELLRFSNGAIHDMINFYTRESGVRSLERRIAGICRKAARRIVENRAKRIVLSSKNLEKYLGKHQYRYEVIEKEALTGVTTGLAWTAVGGTTLSIETSAVAGKGGVVLTGQLGDVMKESARAGISYIRSIAKEIGVAVDFYDKYDIHVHIPEGATPKDGPSAGVTMCIATISTLTNIPARQDVAMTGEITLLGKVLPVGGIREKVLAAHRAGIGKVLLPRDNSVDLEEIPDEVRKKMEFVLLDHVRDALPHVLTKAVTAKKSSSRKSSAKNPAAGKSSAKKAPAKNPAAKKSAAAKNPAAKKNADAY